jgi:hypothetical protein
MKHLLLTTALCSLFAGTAIADETLKYRVVVHITAAQSIPVADVDGHALSVTSGQGLGFMPDGAVIKTSFVSTTDYVHGTGTGNVYYNMVFPDGSVLWVKGVNGQTMSKGDVTEFKVPLTIISGNGKYIGTNGDGLMTGIRASSLPTSGAELALDFTINLKSGNQADAAKAMLTKAVAAIKADRDVALIAFQKGEGGFRDVDLYPFCSRISDGKGLAGPVATLAGTDARTLKDINGKPFGQEQYDAAVKNPEGVMTLVEYMFPKPGTTTPAVPKASWITRIGDLACGVGYYK